MQEPNTIETLLSSVQDGTIAIPIYQRTYTWKIRQVVKLFNFVLSSYDSTTGLQRIPLSPFLLATSTEEAKTQPVTFSNSFEDLPERYFLIVDGRQRTDSIYRSFNGDFDDHIFYNTKFKYFHDTKRPNSNPFIDVPISTLMDPKKWNVYRRTLIAQNKEDSLFDELSTVRDRIMHFKIHTQTAHSLSFVDQIEWFKTVNREGTKLSAEDEIIALATRHDILFRKTLDDVNRVYAKNGFKRKDFQIRSHYELSSDLVLMLPTIFNRLASTKDKSNFTRVLSNPAFAEQDKLRQSFQRRLNHHPVVLNRAFEYIKENELMNHYEITTLELGFILRLFIGETLDTVKKEQEELLAHTLKRLKHIEKADYTSNRVLYQEFNEKLLATTGEERTTVK